jgi:hypothetical protein
VSDLDALKRTAQRRLDQANEMYRQGKEVGTVMSVLLIVLTAREVYGQAAQFVELDFSDQGDFMSLTGVLDGDEIDISDPDLVDDGDEALRRQELWEVFADQVESSCAWNLERDDSTWKQYLAAGFPQRWLFTIDPTIARIRGQV